MLYSISFHPPHTLHSTMLVSVLFLCHVLVRATDTPVAFVHIPKTGGLSFVRQSAFECGSHKNDMVIKDSFSHWVNGVRIPSKTLPRVSPRYDIEYIGMPANITRFFGHVLNGDKHNHCPFSRGFGIYSLVHGHIAFPDLRRVLYGSGCVARDGSALRRRKWRWSTVVREPVDRFRSFYNYFLQNQIRGGIDVTNYTIDAFATFSKTMGHDNYMCRALLGRTTRSIVSLQDRDSEVLDHAMAFDQLRMQFSLVLYTSELKQKRHVTRIRAIDKFSDRERELVKVLEYCDILLYQLITRHDEWIHGRRSPPRKRQHRLVL